MIELFRKIFSWIEFKETYIAIQYLKGDPIFKDRVRKLKVSIRNKIIFKHYPIFMSPTNWNSASYMSEDVIIRLSKNKTIKLYNYDYLLIGSRGTVKIIGCDDLELNPVNYKLLKIYKIE